MRIELEKFGKVLNSRPAGKEAFLAIRPIINLNENKIEIDFSGIISLGPSWADEFFPALEDYFKGKIVYLPTDNLSVKATFEIIKPNINH